MHGNENITIAAIAVLALVLIAGCASGPLTPISGGGPICGDMECVGNEAEIDTATGKIRCPEDCAECADSDGGVNFYSTGTASDTAGNTVLDTCSGDVLTEGFCNYGAARGFRHICQKGCAGSEGGCAGTGAGITKYCAAVDPLAPWDEGRNVLLAKNAYACASQYIPDIEVVFTCAESDGELRFGFVEDCRPGNRVCLDGTCVTAAYFNAVKNKLPIEEIEELEDLLLVKLNRNNANLVGDRRVVRVSNTKREAVAGAKFDVTTPRGGTLHLTTDEWGTAEFILRESGTYSVAVEKADYETFTSKFEVPGIVLEFAHKRGLGEQQAIAVKTAYGDAVADTELLLKMPDGREKTLSTDGSGIAHVKVIMPGRYDIELSRKGVRIVNAHFTGTEITEIVLSLLILLGGAIGGDASVKAPRLLALLTALAFGAMLFGYFRLRPIIPNAVSTRQKRREFLLRGGLSAAFFAAPFAMNRAMDVAGGIALAIFEIAVVLVLYYINKSILRIKKPKVEVK